MIRGVLREPGDYPVTYFRFNTTEGRFYDFTYDTCPLNLDNNPVQFRDRLF